MAISKSSFAKIYISTFLMMCIFSQPSMASTNKTTDTLDAEQRENIIYLMEEDGIYDLGVNYIPNSAVVTPGQPYENNLTINSIRKELPLGSIEIGKEVLFKSGRHSDGSVTNFLTSKFNLFNVSDLNFVYGVNLRINGSNVINPEYFFQSAGGGLSNVWQFTTPAVESYDTTGRIRRNSRLITEDSQCYELKNLPDGDGFHNIIGVSKTYCDNRFGNVVAPTGTWMGSCRHYIFDGAEIRVSCRTIDGAFKENTISTTAPRNLECSNDNGMLKCTKPVPFGSWFNTCDATNYSVEGDYLTTYCKNEAGNPIPTAGYITDAKTTCDNKNGHLSCSETEDNFNTAYKIINASDNWKLYKNQSLKLPNNSELILQANDGNLIQRINNRAMWAAYRVIDQRQEVVDSVRFQKDGNLIAADASDKVRWSSGTEGRGAYLVFERNGNMNIYDSSKKIIWSTRTAFPIN